MGENRVEKCLHLPLFSVYLREIVIDCPTEKKYIVMETYIRFDWAMKRLLRNKANFVVLEGLLTTLLREKITIKHLLESESNQEDEFDKYNRVDLLALNSRQELVIIEVQNNTEYAYFQRMLFGTSKLVTQYINRGEGYSNVRKVYSVNIVYFDLGHGRDFVYHGKTEFRGLHEHDVLELSPFQRQTFHVDTVSQLYPEYYILKVADFTREAKTPLEEWMYYLNTGIVPENATAPGLDEVRERLKVDRMSKDERTAYYRHMDNIVILRDNIATGRMEGRFEGMAEGLEKGRAEGLEKGRAEGLEKGRAEGLEEGRAEGRTEGRIEGEREKALEIARRLKSRGLPAETVAEATGLSVGEVAAL